MLDGKQQRVGGYNPSSCAIAVAVIVRLSSKRDSVDCRGDSEGRVMIDEKNERNQKQTKATSNLRLNRYSLANQDRIRTL